MVLVRSFSIDWKRNMFSLVLMCLAPHGKEKVVKLYLPLPQMESLVAGLQKAIDGQRKGIPAGKDLGYIG